jgi:hypothetical protein
MGQMFDAVRPTHASIPQAHGRNIKVISERLGHTSPEPTLRAGSGDGMGVGLDLAHRSSRPVSKTPASISTK